MNEEQIKELLWGMRTKVTRLTDSEGMIHVDAVFDYLDDYLPREIIKNLTKNDN